MTVVITPVGTSLFRNGGEDYTTIMDLFQDLKDQRASEWDHYTDQIEILGKASMNFIDDAGVIASAEIQSTGAIHNELEDITVHLIASDTIVSRLSAEILQEKLHDLLGVRVEFNALHDVILGLCATAASDFEATGAYNLLGRLDAIYNNLQNNQELAINITGGYAATVSLLTLFAEKKQCPIYYNFEETPDLIEILRYFP